MFTPNNFVIIIGCILIINPTSALYVRKRSTDSNEDERPLCGESTPCRWDIYDPKNRRITESVQSPCDCPADKTCQYDSDHMAITAYVNRCKTPNQSDSTNSV